MTTTKTIEIAGWLSESEVSKGKTALWTGSKIDEVTDVPEGYVFEDNELDAELLKAQAFVDRQVKENNWFITPKAIACEY